MSVILTYVGPLTVLIDQGPKPGQHVQGFSDIGLKVTRAEITEGDGESATMEVTMELNTVPGVDTSTAALGEPVYEIDFTELTKPLETHPRCGSLKESRPKYDEHGVKVTDPTAGGKRRTWEDWADLDADDYESSGDQWDLSTYQSKRRKGIESYNIGAPVVRRTMYYQRPVAGVGEDVFHKQHPPGQANAPTGYNWMLTLDNLLQEGRKRTRKTEWTGAESIDGDIYD